MANTRGTATVEVNGYASRAIRVNAGLSVAQVARAAQLDGGYIRHLENGSRTRMSPEAFASLCRALALADRRALMANPHGTAS